MTQAKFRKQDGRWIIGWAGWRGYVESEARFSRLRDAIYYAQFLNLAV